MSDMRILLVEDDPVYAGAVRRMLGEAGLADGLPCRLRVSSF